MRKKVTKKTRPKRQLIKKATPTVSLCMMVKDEEQFLGQCLNSVKDYVNEIVIVDTGSMDKTVEIAEGFGAKVYRHPWENDFSRHRNQTIGHAMGDWILIMDADEELKPDSGPILRKAIGDMQIDAVIVTISSYFNNKSSQSRGSMVRLFRNHPSVRYEGIIHEQLTGYKSPRMYAIHIKHYGYDLNETALKQKFERTSSLLRQQIKKDPQNYLHHHNLAVCYSANLMYEEAIYEGKEALKLAAKQGYVDHNVLWACYIVSSAFFKLDDLEAAEQYAIKALSLSKSHLDSYFVLTLVYHRQKNWDRLLKASKNFFDTLQLFNKSPEKFTYMIFNAASEEWRVRLALADLYLHTGKKKQSKAEFEKALASSENQNECYRIMGDIYRDNGLIDLAEQYCRKPLNEGVRAPAYLLSMAKVQKAKGLYQAYLDSLKEIRESAPDNVEVLIELGKANLIGGRYEDAIKVYENVMNLSNSTLDVLVNLALAHKYQGNREKARTYNLKALDLEPDSIEALTNLGHLFFENKDFQSSIEVYERALTLDQSLVDVSLRLATIYIVQGNADGCAVQCALMLKALGLPQNFLLNTLQDLADIFLMISSALRQNKKMQLSAEASDIANKLNPDLT